MRIESEALFDKDQTCDLITKLGTVYADDLNRFSVDGLPLGGLGLERFFNVVKNIEYQRDNKGTEVVSRPAYVLLAGVGDCKKKAGLCVSYAVLNGIPYRLACTSIRPDRKVHHVFTQYMLGNKYRNVDATYRHYKLFEPKVVTKVEYYYP